MRSWAFRQLLGLAVGLVTTVFIFVPSAMAQNNAHPTVSQFLANPSQVLAQYPNGGPQLISLVRDAAVKDPSALSAIIALLANASPDQQMAIGSGLGQAALIEKRTNSSYADQIQQDLAAAGNQNAILAFSGVTGNVQTGAGGGGGGGGGGGVGLTGTGQVFGGANNGNSTFGNSSTQTTSQNYFTGGHSFGGASSTVGRSVSAH